MDKSLYNASGCKDRTNMCEVEHGYRKTIRCYEQKRC